MKQAYFKKTMFLFAFIVAVSVGTPLLVFYLSYQTSAESRQINALFGDLNEAKELFGNVSDYEATFRKASTTVVDIEGKTVYAAEGLQNLLAEKLLEKSGIAIDNFNIKAVPPAQRIKLIPPGIWKIFDFSHVSIQGTFPLEKLAEIMAFISTQEKLWRIESLQIRPIDTPTEYISRFSKVETEIAEGRLAEKTAVLDAITQRKDKEMLQLSMSFFVPTTNISQRKETSQ